MNAICYPKGCFEAEFRLRNPDGRVGSGFSGLPADSAGGQRSSVDSAKKPTQVLKDFEMNDVKNGEKTMTLDSIEGRIYEVPKCGGCGSAVDLFL